ncbi:hypothetical protein LBMAG42_21410 [Deltaproteobacteria bacterium]|nr:hypothetical protein LBMAG42_21410 [Deltaproteobacteria bacterium]
MLVTTLLACNSSSDATNPLGTPGEETVEAPAAAAAASVPAELTLGVKEVATPPGLLRLSNRVDQVPARHIEVRVDFAGGDFGSVKSDFERWGFTVEDGDGATLRLLAPAGDRWPERLEPLPGVERVTETLTQDKLPDGAVRGGSANFGPAAYTWSLKDGQLVESLAGGVLPGKVELPRTIPVAVVRCLSPLRTAILDGETSGPGWERALQVEPAAWVLVLESFGACEATGWVVARADAKVDQLMVAGKAVKQLDDATLFAAATRYLSSERAASDESAAAAVDILRRGDDETLKAAITAVIPGSHQERLLLALAQRGEPAAIAFASTSASPTARGWAAGVDVAARQAVLADPASPAGALVTAMSAWRPGAGEAATLERLKKHPDPRVRMRAWDLAIDLGLQPCLARVPDVKKATIEAAKALYAECPQQPVRLQAFSRVVQLDRPGAVALVRATLLNPETERTGINAVRALNSLERDDVLEDAVATVTLDRDVRAEALRTLLRVGRSAAAAGLVEKHGAFLGVKPVDAPAVADGVKPKAGKP